MPPRVCNRRYHPTDDRPAAPERGPTAQVPAGPSPRSLHALDWFVFFLADVLTGFGPFVAVYLASQRWTQLDIGLVLTIGGLVALVGQVPGGALVDAILSNPSLGPSDHFAGSNSPFLYFSTAGR